ncbi:hypothetical protein B0H16DRAFT_1452496 [Mycena metata]|uniref:Uncharacterized protein n=1 Tax=Mycena metata TaxID=1033252 RepID=A0AAD7JQG1_9AGAR|nr:hypothetical protein B0H16DRAFT_1452496 [Mycena metata]
MANVGHTPFKHRESAATALAHCDTLGTMGHRRKRTQGILLMLLQSLRVFWKQYMTMDWDMEEFSSVPKVTRERKFACPKLGNISGPATLVDSQGRIFAWILPRILSLEDQAQVSAYTRGLNSMLAASIKTDEAKKQAGWRSTAQNFVPGTMQGGSVNLSNGWFALGHTDSQYDLKPSNNMANPAVKEWLNAIGGCIQFGSGAYTSRPCHCPPKRKDHTAFSPGNLHCSAKGVVLNLPQLGAQIPIQPRNNHPPVWRIHYSFSWQMGER